MPQLHSDSGVVEQLVTVQVVVGFLKCIPRHLILLPPTERLPTKTSHEAWCFRITMDFPSIFFLQYMD